MMKKLICSIGLAGCLMTASLSSFAVTDASSNTYSYMPLMQLKQEAESGVATAQFYLATRYKMGMGIEQSYPQAFKWFMEAARQDCKEAQLNVGHMLARGQGVTQNIDQAKLWLQKAARLGENRAAYNLAVLEEHDKNLVDALAWYNVTKMSEKNEQARQRAAEKIQMLAIRMNGQQKQAAQDRANTWLSSLQAQ